MIEICSVVYNFQRRWMWQLSSLIQQIDNPHELLINVIYVKNNGTPNTESIIQYFTDRGLKFNLVEFPNPDSFPKSRGQLRNHQFAKSKGDWLFFNDCDVVYSTDFMKLLSVYLTSDFRGIVSAPQFRFTDLALTEKSISELDYVIEVPHAYYTADKFPEFETYQCKVAPGGMQVVQRESVIKYGDNKYVGRYHGDSILGNTGTGSDVWFRRGIVKNSKQKEKIIKLPIQIHLNHYRDISKEKRVKTVNPDYDINYQR